MHEQITDSGREKHNGGGGEPTFRISRPASTRGVAPVRSPIPSEASIGDGLRRLADATERAVSDRIDLARLEAEHAIIRLRAQAEETARRIARGSAFIGAGAVLAAGGWFILMAALIVLLRTWFRLDASIALVGGGNVLIAIVLISTGIAATRRARDGRSGG